MQRMPHDDGLGRDGIFFDAQEESAGSVLLMIMMRAKTVNIPETKKGKIIEEKLSD